MSHGVLRSCELMALYKYAYYYYYYYYYYCCGYLLRSFHRLWLHLSQRGWPGWVEVGIAGYQDCFKPADRRFRLSMCTNCCVRHKAPAIDRKPSYYCTVCLATTVENWKFVNDARVRSHSDCAIVQRHFTLHRDRDDIVELMGVKASN